VESQTLKRAARVVEIRGQPSVATAASRVMKSTVVGPSTLKRDPLGQSLGSVGNNIILQYIALFGAYYISAMLRIAISY
jgi:hypothetical protein